MNTRRTRWSTLVPAAAAVLVACAEAAPPTDHSAVVRDSAGIRIVEQMAVRDVGAGLRVATPPIAVIGSDPGGPLFENVTTGALLESGEFVVGDTGANTGYLFSAAGELLRVVGGPGEGPGEFGRLESVLPLGGDTVLIQDTGNHRVSLFAGGELVRDWRLEAFIDMAGYSLIAQRTAGDYILSPTSYVVGRDREAGWASFPLLTASADFDIQDELTQVDAIQWRAAEDRNPIIFFGSTVRAGTTLAHARTSRPEVTWLDETGAPVQINRWLAAEQHANDSIWDAYETDFRTRYRDRDPAFVDEQITERRRDFGGPLPYFLAASGDGVGRVWLGTWNIVRRFATEHIVVSPDRDQVDVVRFDHPARVLDASDDFVLVVITDELDVQSVALYEVRDE